MACATCKDFIWLVDYRLIYIHRNLAAGQGSMQNQVKKLSFSSPPCHIQLVRDGRWGHGYTSEEPYKKPHTAGGERRELGD